MSYATTKRVILGTRVPILKCSAVVFHCFVVPTLHWLNLTKYLFDNKEDITDVRGTIHHNGPLADGWGVTCLLEMMAYLK